MSHTTKNERELALQALKGELIAKGCRKIGELSVGNEGGILRGDFWMMGVWSTPGGELMIREDWHVETGKIEKPNRRPTRLYDCRSYEVYAPLTKDGTHHGTLKAVKKYLGKRNEN